MLIIVRQCGSEVYLHFGLDLGRILSFVVRNEIGLRSLEVNLKFTSKACLVSFD